MRLERAEYEAALAERRYLEVDPSQRLVAATLERRWNAALLQWEELKKQAAQFRQQQARVATPEQKTKVLALASHLPQLWYAPTTQAKDRKRMLRLLIKDITVDGALLPVRFVLHDRDSKFCASFHDTLRSAGVQPLSLPARSPNLNAFAERWVRSIESECLSKLILFGEASLRRAVTQFIEHYHLERPHQGKGNQLLFPSPVSPPSPRAGRIQCRERLGGPLKFYQRAA